MVSLFLMALTITACAVALMWAGSVARDFWQAGRREHERAAIRQQTMAAKRAVGDITTRAQAEMLRLVSESRNRR